MSYSQPSGRYKRRPKNLRKMPRNHRKPNYRLLCLLFFVSVLVSGAASYAVQTDSFVVREVRIEGVKLADRALVERFARRSLGQNILLLRKGPVVRNVGGLSEVESVRMGRSFPDGVWLQVKERQPGAMVSNGKQLCLAQYDGLIYHSLKQPIKGVPLVETHRCGQLKEGAVCDSAQVQCALRVAKCAAEKDLQIDKISVDPVGYICLNIGSGFYVRLGQPDDIAGKLTFLKKALALRPAIVREALYMDLSCPNAYVWKPRSASKPPDSSRS